VELPFSSVAPALRASSSRNIAASSFFLLRVRRGAGTVLQVLRAQATALHFRGPELRPNNSFKPKPLRYSKSVAEKPCHAFASTTRFGLTQALGRTKRVQRFGGVGVVVSPLLRQVFVSRRRRACLASWSSQVAASRLRFVVPQSNIAATWLVLVGGYVAAQVRLSACSRRKPSRFTVVGYNCGLTIHSSRTRFVAWLKCVVVPLSQLTDWHVAGRLNSGVRPQETLCLPGSRNEHGSRRLFRS